MEANHGESKICIAKDHIKHLIKMVHDQMVVTSTLTIQCNKHSTGLIGGLQLYKIRMNTSMENA